MDVGPFRLVVLLLDLRHPRVQLHQAVHRGLPVAIDAANQIQVGIARHLGYFTSTYRCPPIFANTYASISGSIHVRLRLAHHLPMQTGCCWLRLEAATAFWNSYMLQPRHLQESRRLQ